jgi:5-methylcytosine-specific restriction endonuclease McrA
VIAKRGAYCRSCGTGQDLQADHVMPKSQGGRSVVENGTMLCRTCHQAKTEKRIKYKREWLDEDQVDWLAKTGWVSWDEDGRTRGPGYRGFENVGVAE